MHQISGIKNSVAHLQSFFVLWPSISRQRKYYPYRKNIYIHGQSGYTDPGCILALLKSGGLKSQVPKKKVCILKAINVAVVGHFSNATQNNADASS